MSIVTSLDFRLRKRFYAFIVYNSLINLIFFSYIKETNKSFIVIFKLSDLNDFNVFSNKIKASLSINISYIIFIKIRYFSDNFCICDK